MRRHLSSLSRTLLPLLLLAAGALGYLGTLVGVLGSTGVVLIQIVTWLVAGAIAGNFWVSFLKGKQLPVSQVFFINALIIVGIGIFMMLTLPRVPRPSSGSGTSLQI